MVGIGGVYRAYRSLVSKRHHEKDLSPKKSQPEDPKDKLKSIDEICKALQDSVGNYDPSTPSPLSRSTSHTSLSRKPSLSRSDSRRSKTPTPTSAARRFLRSISRKNNVDEIASPQGVSLSRSTSSWKKIADEIASPKGVSLSRSTSSRKKNADEIASPQGVSLSRSTSSRKASTSVFPEGVSLSKSTSSLKVSTSVSPGGRYLSRSTSSRKGIMYSNSNGLMKPPAVEKTLECTLEDLCFGCVKRITVTRDVVTNDGQVVEEEEKLTIKVTPGWTKGTKITFEGTKNEATGMCSADITFVVEEKNHSMFRREGDDLEMRLEVPLVTALIGGNLSFPLLGGEKMMLEIDDVIEPGYEKVIAGEGMPKAKEHGNRGNLVVKFEVQFPTELTDEQRSEAFSILQDSC